MPKRLYTYCCRLCLHDGSVHELFNIFSLEGLSQKILSIFNIKVTPQDACSTNICLTCFNEAMILDREMRLFKQQKQTVLNNQQRLKKGLAPATTKSETPAASQSVQAVVASKPANVTQNLPVGVSTISLQAQPTSADGNIRNNASKRLNSSSKTIANIDLDKTNSRKNSSKKAHDKQKLSHPSTKVACSKANASSKTLKSRTKTPELSSPGVKRPQPAVEPVKNTGGNLQTPSGSNCPNGQHSANGKTASNAMKVTTSATGVETNKSSNHNVPHRTVSSIAVEHTENVVVSVASNAEKTKTIVHDANQNVQKYPNASIQRSGQNNASVAVQDGGQQPVNKKSNNGLQSITTQKNTLNQVSTVTEGSAHRQSIIVEPSAEVPVAEKDRRSVSFLGAKFKPTFTPLQGGVCSIPLENIPRTVCVNESRTVAVSSTANLLGTSTTASLATDGQHSVSTTTNPLNNACVPAGSSQLPSVSSNVLASEVAPVGIRDDSTINNACALAGSSQLPSVSSNVPVGEVAPVGNRDDSTINNAFALAGSSQLPSVSSNVPAGEVAPVENRDDSTINNAFAPAGSSQLPSVSSNVPAAEVAPVGNRDDSTINNVVSPGTIKKRRHSTYIRVSSNLFDEPPEKAQFAMLNNNLFIRNVQSNVAPTGIIVAPTPTNVRPTKTNVTATTTNVTRTQTNVPPLATYSCLPILPKGMRVRAVINPQVMRPFNSAALNSNVMNQYSPMNGRVQTTQQPTITVSQRPSNHAQAIATNTTNFGNATVVNYLPSINTSSTIPPQRPIVSAPIQQTSVVTNRNINSSYSTGSANNSHVNANFNANNANHFSNSSMTQSIRPCYKCILCNTYYLVEHNLESHMRNSHMVEKNEHNFIVVYDNAMIEKIKARYRRKSIADPLLLSGNRS